MGTKLGVKSWIRLQLGAACLFFIFLAGCGKKEYTTTTLEFEKTGAIVLNIVETWDSALYDFNELCAMNEKEVAEYNGSTEKVTILSSELKDGKAYICMQYADDNYYYDLNKSVLFYGNVSAAKNAGYNLTGKVKSTENGEELIANEWNNMTTEKVIVLEEAIDIVTPSSILYVSDGCNVTGTDTLTTESGGLRYIIVK